MLGVDAARVSRVPGWHVECSDAWTVVAGRHEEPPADGAWRGDGLSSESRQPVVVGDELTHQISDVSHRNDPDVVRESDEAPDQHTTLTFGPSAQEGAARGASGALAKAGVREVGGADLVIADGGEDDMSAASARVAKATRTDGVGRVFLDELP